jgi:predicted nucleotidyltransferase
LKFSAKLAFFIKSAYFCKRKRKIMSTRQLEIEGLIKHLGVEILPKNAQLMLFGSQARDEATPDSDWDLLILLEGEKVSNDDFDRWVFPFISLGWSLGVEINPVVYTYDEWRRRQITPFYKNVMKERVVLC